MNRQELIDICESSFIDVKHWWDRDSSGAMMQIGQCYALLKCNCKFKILTEKDNTICITDERTIWIEIEYKGFSYFDSENDALTKQIFYLPTQQRLSEYPGKDWY